MKAKKSEIFWTSILVLLLLLLLYTVDIELFLGLWLGLGSLISIFGILNSFIDCKASDETIAIKIDLWLIVFPMTWLIIIVFNIIYFSEYLYIKVIKPFNDKLNG